MEVVLCVCMHRLRKMKRMNEAEEGGQGSKATKRQTFMSRDPARHKVTSCHYAVLLSFSIHSSRNEV
jgi:hypothetical protein